jgi:tryptophan-rich sensory protein
MGSIPENTWYSGLQKAPWTPPGWVFGAAWFTIMLTFSIFLYVVSGKYTFQQLRSFYLIFSLQFILNVLWNPVFFRWHFVLPGLIIISALTLVVAYMIWWGFNKQINATWLVTPYLIWLIIATSLNAYILIKN